MKNFPHQFNDLNKLLKSLIVVRQLIQDGIPLTDENFGEQLTREGIYTYRDKTLSVEEFLEHEKQKPAANRGHLTVSRDIRRFFELIGFITTYHDKTAKLNPSANQLLASNSDEIQKELWKNALLQLGLEGSDGEVSHPYRILLKLVNYHVGIETSKLMLALEAENNSNEEFERILALSQLNLEKIIQDTGTTTSMAANAVKILPGIAEQLGDLERIDNKAYPSGQVIITEDEISTVENSVLSNIKNKTTAQFRKTSAENIAKEPNLQIISSISVDLTEAIRIRQKRLLEHQEIVRLLAFLNEKYGFQIFEGKFDCLAIKDNTALLYEVKTILSSLSDVEKQTVKGVGQLKYYKFSIVKKQMGYDNINEILVFSKKPSDEIIEFLSSENIVVCWREDDSFKIFNINSRKNENFSPDNFL